MATLQAPSRHAGTAQWSADGRRCGLLRDIHRARSSSQHRCHGSQQSAHDRTASRLLTHTPAQSIERRTPHAHSFGHAPPSSDATRAIQALLHCYASNLSYSVLLCQSQNAELGFPPNPPLVAGTSADRFEVIVVRRMPDESPSTARPTTRITSRGRGTGSVTTLDPGQWVTPLKT